MVICLVYIGIIVMLHIFGKVKSQSLTPNIPTPEADDLDGNFSGDPDPEPTGDGAVGSGEL